MRLARKDGPDTMPIPLPEELYVEVTNRCNSRCETCVHTFQRPEPHRDMAPEQFRRLVDQFPRLRRVVLHGVGEPLLNANLPTMIDHLKRRAAPPHVLFNSNAILLDPAWQDKLLSAGLDEYRISIDAAHAALYARIRGVDAFDRVVSNVTAFARRIAAAGAGPRLSLWCTAIRENLGDLPNLVRLANRIGVGEVYVQRMVYHGDGLALEAQSIFRAMQAAEEALLAEAEREAQQLGVIFRASGATTPRDSLLSSDGNPRPWTLCHRPESVMYITANGNCLPCCLSPFTARNYGELILGNAFQTPLIEIWNGDAYRRFRAARQTQEPPEACDRCGIRWSL
jgi:radical SAM protein with 4Fe4S-binding SPASM domain